MKALQTTQDTELAEFLYKLSRTPRNWDFYSITTKLRSIRALGICPLAAVFPDYKYPTYNQHPDDVPIPKELKIQIMQAADGMSHHDPCIRQALLRAVDLNEHQEDA